MGIDAIHTTIFDRDDLPHAELITSNTIYDPSFFTNAIYFHKLTLKDAYFEIEGCTILLRPLYYQKTSERKRCKPGVEEVIPVSELTGLGIKGKKFTRKQILDKLDELNPRREAACNNEIIVKGHLITLAKALNELLLDGAKDDNKHYLFNSASKRYEVITDWINWYFYHGYGIRSSYCPEQIRQLITKDNKYSGIEKSTFLTEIYQSDEDDFQPLAVGLRIDLIGRDGTLAN